MKKLIVCLVAIVAVLMFAGLTTVHAWPYTEVEGFVNPYVGTVVDDGTYTTFGEVQYTFNVTKASYWNDYVLTPDPYLGPDPNPLAAMDGISLEFNSNTFQSFGAVLPGYTPPDWTFFPASTYEIGISGSTLGLGGQLQFSVKDVVVLNEALIDPDLWQEDAIWGQSWLSTDTLGGGDGGSTALVPEPGTLILFGSGLVGLFYVRRKKAFNI